MVHETAPVPVSLTSLITTVYLGGSDIRRGATASGSQVISAAMVGPQTVRPELSTSRKRGITLFWGRSM